MAFSGKEHIALQQTAFPSAFFVCETADNAIYVGGATEETYGYQAIDASIMGVPFIAPDAFGYKEVVRQDMRYKNKKDMVDKIRFWQGDSSCCLTPWALLSAETWVGKVMNELKETS